MYFRSTPAAKPISLRTNPMTEELKERLEEMENLQGSIVFFNDRNIIFSHACCRSFYSQTPGNLFGLGKTTSMYSRSHELLTQNSPPPHPFRCRYTISFVLL